MATISLFDKIPEYVIIFILFFIFVMGVGSLCIVAYYIYRKFNAIERFIDKKSDNDETTYKKIKNEYEKDVSELDAKIFPNKQNISNAINKIVEFKKK